MENMVQPLVHTCLLDRQHVEGLFNNANRTLVTIWTGTNRTGVRACHIITFGTENKAALKVGDSFGQILASFRRLTNQMKGQSLSGLGTDPW